MSKPVDPNAKLALNQMKMEISKELLNDSNIKNDSNPIDSIGLSGRVGGQMSKKLVEMGERELLKRYNK
ncbi:small, acid-soluble spore protein, alpha/beta type [Terrisporobacter hibernicus]|uniref:Alpha/beta-type small acid-soluble spore protein n=1 Tax=Terrisporobacter hibernicus TaxID=2813371 RepID=A0AAX2ZFQ0_9FIRM|nr:small, acid-soluble spore protein, alpha/beta type [Terrisporobacter hibernicus]UEL47666.1 alpha/beta-type small acid-soluble spore protein [Terrisporobacter hibernicus]